MTTNADNPLVAVDVGNTRIKLGLFAGHDDGPLPTPLRTLDVPSLTGDLNSIGPWLDDLAVSDVSWWIGSVNRPAMTRLLEWLRNRPHAPSTTLLAAGDLPLRVALPQPDMVGIDRLLNAVGANALRVAQTGAVVVDVGTAITVDRVSIEGTFEGGAILPGIGLSARALHEFTDLLPLLGMAELEEPPPPLGTETLAALRSGLFWGAVGGVRELIDRLGRQQPRPPQIFLTGGAAPSVAGLLAASAVYSSHLTLGGIVLAAMGKDRLG
ncbi:MAG: type III pantothenate kinase [Pirellulales bacterium]